MFQSSWISAVGLAIEIVGLYFLFRDLLMSKTSDGAIAEFRKLQDDLEVSNRDVVLRTHSGFQTFLNFMRGYLSILEIEAQEAANPSDLAQVRRDNPELAKLIDFIHGKGPVGLRRDAVEKFVAASGDLLSRADVERALEVNGRTRAALERQYSDQLLEAESLRRIAKIGIALVSVGALSQFADLFI
jgi:hypothetical protein